MYIYVAINDAGYPSKNLQYLTSIVLFLVSIQSGWFLARSECLSHAKGAIQIPGVMDASVEWRSEEGKEWREVMKARECEAREDKTSHDIAGEELWKERQSKTCEETRDQDRKR